MHKRLQLVLGALLVACLAPTSGISQGTISGGGTISGAGTVSASGAASTARHFDGTDTSYLEHVDSVSLDTPSAAITVALWLRPTADAQNASAQVIRKVYAANASYGIYQSGSSNRQYGFRVYVAGGPQNTAASSALDVDTWYFVVGRWVSGDYVNLDVYDAGGSLVSHTASSVTITGTIAYDTGVFRVGNYPGTPGYAFTGDVARIYVDDTSLSDGDRQTLQEGTQPHAASGGYWVLGVDSPEPDTSGNGNDLTVTGTTIVSGP
jgi:Concanavalin A-like lectin/glucanases superfamily